MPTCCSVLSKYNLGCFVFTLSPPLPQFSYKPNKISKEQTLSSRGVSSCVLMIPGALPRGLCSKPLRAVFSASASLSAPPPVVLWGNAGWSKSPMNPPLLGSPLFSPVALADADEGPINKLVCRRVACKINHQLDQEHRRKTLAAACIVCVCVCYCNLHIFSPSISYIEVLQNALLCLDAN